MFDMFTFSFIYDEFALRMLVYEYIDNGNLEQWLHGEVGPISPLTWDIRMRIAIGTAKGCVSFFFSFFFLRLLSQIIYIDDRLLQKIYCCAA